MNIPTRILRVGSAAAQIHNVKLRMPTPDIDYILGSVAAERMLAFNRAEGYRVDLRAKDHVVLHGTKRIIELTIAWPGTTNWELLERYGSDDGVRNAGPTILLAMKESHRFRDTPHFEKTRRDILFLRKLVMNPRWDPHPGKTEELAWLSAWSQRRAKEAAQDAPKLNMTRDKFFTSNVNYVYDHDSVHRALARGGVPAYKSFQKDGAEVMVDKAKWDRLQFNLQLNSVLEEAAVLAIERILVPNDFRPDPRVAIRIGLQKVATSISSGWWREFAWEHYDDALHLAHGWDYAKQFREGLTKGVVQPYR